MAAANDVNSANFVDLIQEAAGATNQPSQSEVESGSTAARQMLSIPLDKLPLLERVREKVEKNYCVKIHKDKCCASDGKSASDTQWITISGSKGDCKDAGVSLLTF